MSKPQLPCQTQAMECELLKHFIFKPLTKEPTIPTEQDVPTKDFPELTWCFMIFGGAKAYGDKHRIKAAH